MHSQLQRGSTTVPSTVILLHHFVDAAVPTDDCRENRSFHTRLVVFTTSCSNYLKTKLPEAVWSPMSFLVDGLCVAFTVQPVVWVNTNLIQHLHVHGDSYWFVFPSCSKSYSHLLCLHAQDEVIISSPCKKAVRSSRCWPHSSRIIKYLHTSSSILEPKLQTLVQHIRVLDHSFRISENKSCSDAFWFVELPHFHTDMSTQRNLNC